jgi:hypothetical protein
MIVNNSPDDNTWQIHLDGLLAVLPQIRLDEARPNSLLKAAQILDSQIHVAELFATVAMPSMEKAGLVLDIAKLQLRQLMVEMNKLSQDMSSLRQIDLSKFRRAIKQSYRNLGLVLTLLHELASPQDPEETTSSKAEGLSTSMVESNGNEEGGYCECKPNYIL